MMTITRKKNNRLQNLPATILMAVCCLTFTHVFSQLKKNTEEGPQLYLKFNLKAGNANLLPGGTYTNPFGEAYTVQKFRFYITQILLQDSTSTEVQFFPDDYYLVDAGDTSSRKVKIPLSLSKVTSLSFMIGVDSITNVSGVQTGALDPANGMFWTWNSGYIMLKLLAISPVANVPANAFTFDVGGYKPGENAARKVEFVIKSRQPVHYVTLNVDINKLFNGAHPVKIAEHPMVHEPGKTAMELADNYATMFTIQQVSK